MILPCPSFNMEEKLYHPLICSSSFLSTCHDLQVMEDIERVAKIPLENEVGKYQF